MAGSEIDHELDVTDVILIDPGPPPLALGSTGCDRLLAVCAGVTALLPVGPRTADALMETATKRTGIPLATVALSRSR